MPVVPRQRLEPWERRACGTGHNHKSAATEEGSPHVSRSDQPAKETAAGVLPIRAARQDRTIGRLLDAPFHPGKFLSVRLGASTITRSTQEPLQDDERRPYGDEGEQRKNQPVALRESTHRQPPHLGW